MTSERVIYFWLEGGGRKGREGGREGREGGGGGGW